MIICHEISTSKPIDKEWKGSISWDPLPSDILDLTISLVTPTDHSRFRKAISFLPAITPPISTIIAGKDAVRIRFDPVPNAKEYFVRYYAQDQAVQESYKTITNTINIDNLAADQTYNFQLFAVNDKRQSQASATVKATTNQQILPPIIWDSFITDNKLVIGYSSEFTDGNYIIQYGASEDHLDQEFISNVRGMVSIDLDGENEIYFKIKRMNQGEESHWSQQVKSTKR